MVRLAGLIVGSNNFLAYDLPDHLFDPDSWITICLLWNVLDP